MAACPAPVAADDTTACLCAACACARAGAGEGRAPESSFCAIELSSRRACCAFAPAFFWPSVAVR